MDKTTEGWNAGDIVEYREEPGTEYTIYRVYSNDHVSLGLEEYPDTEADSQVATSELNLVRKAQ